MKISVALCTYNGARFLREQLDSILNQSHPVDEIVVSDDGSTDGTLAILHLFKESHPDIFVIHENSVNLKSNANFELAIQKCTGDYVFLSDQDDVWCPDKVKIIFETFLMHPDAEAVFSNGSFIDEFGSPVHERLSLWESVRFFQENISTADDFLRSLIFNGNFVTGAALCIKKSSLTYCLPFQTGKRFLHDEWLAFVYAKRQTIVMQSEKLIKYRLHSDQQVGVGSIKNANKLREKNQKKHRLMMLCCEPKIWSDYKFMLKTYFNQYEKYFMLNKGYCFAGFFIAKNELRDKFCAVDKAMKKKNLLFYIALKVSDFYKGKRQLKKYEDNDLC